MHTQAAARSSAGDLASLRDAPPMRVCEDRTPRFRTSDTHSWIETVGRRSAQGHAYILGDKIESGMIRGAMVLAAGIVSGLLISSMINKGCVSTACPCLMYDNC
jgi:hypothetical protein